MAEDDTTGDAMSELVEALAEHRLVKPVQCRCGWRETDGHGEQWHEHAAAVVLAALDLPAREAAAEQRGRESVGLADFLPDLCGDEERPVVHAVPPAGSGLTPCCRRSPFELAHDDRMTWEVSVVTCGGHVTEADRG